jgi:hypothetical protein
MPRSAITRINGGLQVAANTTNKNNGFYAPQLTTAQRDVIPAATLVNGAIIYNTTTNTFQNYTNGAWNNVNSSVATAGVGLVAGSSPVILPSGARATVEVAQNQIAGFTYYDTTNNVTRTRNNAAWVTITVV